MSKKKRNTLIYLQDIFQSMGKIQSYIEEMEFADFENDEKTQDAVIRNFIIIGEAANNLPDTLKAKYSELPWKKMYGLRNIVSHAYFGIDFEVIWKIASEQLPENKKELERVITLEKLAK